MTKKEAIAKVQAAFQNVPRPEEFIRGTCYCDECMEHNQTLAAHTPDTITLAELGHPSWDPITFASDQAFAYYLPGMIRLAFGPDYYLDQLLFHLNNPGRLDALNERQAQTLLDALWLLYETRADEIANNRDEPNLEAAIHSLEQLAARADHSSGPP